MKLSDSLDTDIDRYLHIVNTDPNVASPYVISARSEGVIRALLVCLLRKTKTSAIIAFVKIPGPFGTILEILKNGRMGQRSSDIDKLMALQISNVLESERIDLLSLDCQPSHLDLVHCISETTKLGFKRRIVYGSSGSLVPLISHDGNRPYVFSSKVLREIKRKTRILQRQFPNRIIYRCFCSANEIKAGMCDAFSVATRSWQHPLGHGLVNSRQTREDLRFSSKKGWLRIYILYVDDVPCAYLIGELYRKTFYSRFAGFDIDFARYSVGCLVMHKALLELATSGAQQVDLGVGNSEYNRRLGCVQTDSIRMHGYAYTYCGQQLRLFFGATQAVRTIGRKILARFELNYIAKLWRNSLVRMVTFGPKGRLFEGRKAGLESCDHGDFTALQTDLRRRTN